MCIRDSFSTVKCTCAAALSIHLAVAATAAMIEVVAARRISEAQPRYQLIAATVDAYSDSVLLVDAQCVLERVVDALTWVDGDGARQELAVVVVNLNGGRGDAVYTSSVKLGEVDIDIADSNAGTGALGWQAESPAKEGEGGDKETHARGNLDRWCCVGASDNRTFLMIRS